MATHPSDVVIRPRPPRRFPLAEKPKVDFPLSRTARQRQRAASYRRIVVCLSANEGSARAVSIAYKLAAEKHALLILGAAIEVPLEMPLDTPDKAAEAAARDAVHAAQAITEAYGVPVEGVILRARDAGEAIVAEVTLRRAEVVVVAAEWPQDRQHLRHLSDTTDHVLKHAPLPRHADRPHRRSHLTRARPWRGDALMGAVRVPLEPRLRPCGRRAGPRRQAALVCVR